MRISDYINLRNLPFTTDVSIVGFGDYAIVKVRERDRFSIDSKYVFDEVFKYSPKKIIVSGVLNVNNIVNVSCPCLISGFGKRKTILYNVTFRLRSQWIELRDLTIWNDGNMDGIVFDDYYSCWHCRFRRLDIVRPRYGITHSKLNDYHHADVRFYNIQIFDPTASGIKLVSSQSLNIGFIIFKEVCVDCVQYHDNSEDTIQLYGFNGLKLVDVDVLSSNKTGVTIYDTSNLFIERLSVENCQDFGAWFENVEYIYADKLRISNNLQRSTHVGDANLALINVKYGFIRGDFSNTPNTNINSGIKVYQCSNLRIYARAVDIPVGISLIDTDNCRCILDVDVFDEEGTSNNNTVIFIRKPTTIRNYVSALLKGQGIEKQGVTSITGDGSTTVFIIVDNLDDLFISTKLVGEVTIPGLKLGSDYYVEIADVDNDGKLELAVVFPTAPTSGITYNVYYKLQVIGF